MGKWTRDQKIALLGVGVGTIGLVVGALAVFSTTHIEGDVRVVPFTDQADNFFVSFAFSSFGVTAVGVEKNETSMGGSLGLAACFSDSANPIPFSNTEWAFLSNADEKRFTSQERIQDNSVVNFILTINTDDADFSVVEQWNFGNSGVDRVQRVVLAADIDCSKAREALG
ncbi:MAG: hypothetical protein AAF234_09105 [Pseudomonadota bacterium]